MKRIIFLRHPQTAFNIEPMRLRGGLDVPLSPHGFAQIPDICTRLMQAHPDIKQIYSSPLERASILATTIAHEFNLKVTKLDGLKSWDYGVLNGKYIKDVIDVLKQMSTGAGRLLAPKDGESMIDFLTRLGPGTPEKPGAIKDIIYHAPEEGCVLVVSHLQNIMIGAHWLSVGLPENIEEMPYDYKETNEIEPGDWIEIRRDWVILKELKTVPAEKDKNIYD
jgi:broad specificity phosphatase PhoE